MRTVFHYHPGKAHLLLRSDDALPVAPFSEVIPYDGGPLLTATTVTHDLGRRTVHVWLVARQELPTLGQHSPEEFTANGWEVSQS